MRLAATVNAGARLDRLPISSFHRRIMWLIGIGMFFDGFDIYVAATVLGATLKSGFSTMGQNAEFVSVTFLGMMLGSFLTGFLGDRYGRRFTYQANLAIFGLASIAAAFAPSMPVLILLRFVMGLGLGAENVVGYATMTEFVPPQARGKWLGVDLRLRGGGLPVTALLGTLIIPRFGWRIMFVLGGTGRDGRLVPAKSAAGVAALVGIGRPHRRGGCHSSRHRTRGCRSHHAPLNRLSASAPAIHSRGLGSLLSPVLLPRMIVGAITLIVVNTLIFGFVTWLPTFFVQEGRSIASSLGYSLVMSLGAPLGSAIGALTADSWGRKPTIARRFPAHDRDRQHLSLCEGSRGLADGGFPADDSDLRSGHAAFCNLHPGAVPDRGSHAGLGNLQHLRPGRDDSDAFHRRCSVQVLRRGRRLGS